MIVSSGARGGNAGSPTVRSHSEYSLNDGAPWKTCRLPTMCAIRNSTMMMPLTAMTTFLKTELVFATFGVLRWTESVTVTTRATLGPLRVAARSTRGDTLM